MDGSPTDAVSLAFLGYFGHGFDLVAAGINYGANLGDDITYSGTVSAAMEAVINSCPAFAISQEYYAHPDFALAGRAATAVAKNILEHGLSPGELINVNVPAVALGDDATFEVTRLGKRVYQDQLIERQDPRGIPYFWIGGPPPSGLAVPGTDFHAVVNRRIAVTPIHLDLTGRQPAQAAADVGLGRASGAGGRAAVDRRRLTGPGSEVDGCLAPIPPLDGDLHQRDGEPRHLAGTRSEQDEDDERCQEDHRDHESARQVVPDGRLRQARIDRTRHVRRRATPRH